MQEMSNPDGVVNKSSAYVGKGNVLYDLKHYEQALEAYEQAFQVDPHSPSASYGKGNALRHLALEY